MDKIKEAIALLMDSKNVLKECESTIISKTLINVKIHQIEQYLLSLQSSEVNKYELKNEFIYVPVPVEDKPVNNTKDIAVTVPVIHKDGLISYGVFYNDGFISYDKSKGEITHWLKKAQSSCPCAGVWVKASEELPENYGWFIYRTKEGIGESYFSNHEEWEKENIVEWLKELPPSTETEELKKKIKAQSETIAGNVMYQESLLETNRKLGERIAEKQEDALEELQKENNLYCEREILFENRIKYLESLSLSNVAAEKIDIGENQYLDFSKMVEVSEETKKEFINLVTAGCAKELLKTFLGCGLKTFIEQMIKDEVTNTEYVLTFQTVENFTKRFHQLPPVDALQKAIDWCDERVKNITPDNDYNLGFDKAFQIMKQYLISLKSK